MRKLVWTDHCEYNLNETISVLNVINPHGHNAKEIKAHVQREFDAGLESYVGTGGWYVTVYKAPGSEDTWHALVTLMTFTVARYLKMKGHM